jgi:hypothetical protein
LCPNALPLDAAIAAKGRGRTRGRGRGRLIISHLSFCAQTSAWAKAEVESDRWPQGAAFKVATWLSGNRVSLTPSPSPRRERGSERRREATISTQRPTTGNASFAQSPYLPGACPAKTFHSRRATAMADATRQAGHAGEIPSTASHRTVYRRLLLHGSSPGCGGRRRSSLPKTAARSPTRCLACSSRHSRASSAKSPNSAPSGSSPGPHPSSPLRPPSGAPLLSGEGLGVRPIILDIAHELSARFSPRSPLLGHLASAFRLA